MHKVVLVDPQGMYYVADEQEVLWKPSSKRFSVRVNRELEQKRAELQHLRELQSANAIQRSTRKLLEFVPGHRAAA